MCVTVSTGAAWHILGLKSNGMPGQSPLKAKPLRVPGQSVDEEIDRSINDTVNSYFLAAALLCVLSAMEWVGYLTHSPRHPVLFSVMAVIGTAAAAWRSMDMRRRVQRLRLGRDGERAVGQFLERLRDGGARVFHDVQGEGFNLDHVVISPQGLYAIETKTYSKPWSNAKITVEGESLKIAGQIPDRDPIVQVSLAARWLEDKLQESTGKRFAVRGVVVFPGWFVEQQLPRGPVWVLEPKMLPGFIEQEPKSVMPEDVALAAFHLSRYVRAMAE
jgi:Nuclease-related domain